MGNKSSLLLRPEEIAEIQEETGCKCDFIPKQTNTNFYVN